MNYAIEQFGKYVQENCNYKIRILETENFGLYDFYFEINNGTIKLTYKIDYSKSFEENLSCIKYELLYKIFKGGN